MSDLNTILKKISDLTYRIEIEYPELYQFLDEDPMTIPSIENPEMGKKVMQEYFEDLKEKLKQYSKTHKTKRVHK